MINKPLISMSRDELKKHIFNLQKFIEKEQEMGKDIDTILDETDIFDEFEDVLPDEEFPIFIITILNGFQSDTLIDKLLDVIDECKNGK
jgi:hypothetical protein|tara:strand:- start:256 stop:522 length:267 start_codon:yes stop_codon:yes gene_type:complete